MTMKRKSKFQMTTMSIENIIICFIIGSIFPLQTTSNTIEIAQLVGRTVSLNCPQRSSDNIKWIFNKDNKDFYFYEGETFKGVQFKDRCRFENDSATGNEALKISDIKPGDAGLYKCLAASYALLQSTQLTVLDSEPTCNSNIKDNGFVGPNTCGLSEDYIRFSCAVSYHGTKAPRLQWEDIKNNQILKDLKCDGSQPNRMNCTLMLKAEPQYDGSDFRCKVVTSYGEQYNCSTKAIKVHYFTLEEHALKPKHKAIDDEISCPVESNLKLNFSWIWVENKINKEEVVSTNRSYIIDEEGLYYCNVSYSIKDTNCWDVVSVVCTTQRQEGPTINLAILAIINLLALFVFEAVSYFLFEIEQIKGALNQLEIDSGWSVILIIFYAAFDIALLLVVVVKPTENLLNMKYALTFILLILTVFESVSFLFLWKRKPKVSSSIVKIILLLVIFITIGVAIAAAVIVTEDLCLLWDNCEWTVTIIFFDILIIVGCVFLVLFAIKLCRRVSSGVMKVIVVVILLVIVVVCLAIAVKVFIVEILSVVNKILSGFVCGITVFLTVVAALCKLVCPEAALPGTTVSSGKTEALSKTSEAQEQELRPLGKEGNDLPKAETV